MEDSNISGKAVAITGASSGLGDATARALAKVGAKVALGARRIDRLQAVSRAIEADGGTRSQRKPTSRIANRSSALSTRP